MEKNLTLEFEGKPYFLFENEKDGFCIAQSITCIEDNIEKQYCSVNALNATQLLLGKDLEEVPTNDISLLLRVPWRGFIKLEIIDVCRRFAKTAGCEYVSAKKLCFTHYEKSVTAYCRPLNYQDEKIWLYEVQPQLFRAVKKEVSQKQD